MSNVPARLAIDAHVHLHDAASAKNALIAAQARMIKVAGPKGIGVVMLAERSGFDVFETLRPELLATDEPEALWLDEGHRLLILAGRQIISAERLEILALATSARLPDGLPAEEIVEKLDATGALVVLPWGVGKWIGSRGKLVGRLIAAARPGRLFLGDNSGRPGFWRVPQFALGLPVLAGTDPLPLKGWPDAIGSFGSIVRGLLPVRSPAASLKLLLRDPTTPVERFGKLAGPFGFVFDQTRLRLAGSGAIQ